ncbi:hypothetical protein H7U12_15045 [Rufibacter sp. H-1]|uniref:Peptidylprolyl isomerase n=1 Tax=Rufibacter sediminis TaxID=2762756 RepID=A0ABR6VV00_9BACT|nr:hypothetical protein [Rufibacter sediminis]MBC3541009.1 hypothetical protein [Rufibacter sediminis]
MIFGVSMADTPQTATVTAREIANALQLNEAQYLKIRLLEQGRMKEVKEPQADVAAINKKYTAALLEVLSAEQKVAFQAFAKANPSMQIAQLQ